MPLVCRQNIVQRRISQLVQIGAYLRKLKYRQAPSHFFYDQFQKEENCFARSLSIVGITYLNHTCSNWLRLSWTEISSAPDYRTWHWWRLGKYTLSLISYHRHPLCHISVDHIFPCPLWYLSKFPITVYADLSFDLAKHFLALRLAQDLHLELVFMVLTQWEAKALQ